MYSLALASTKPNRITRICWLFWGSRVYVWFDLQNQWTIHKCKEKDFLRILLFFQFCWMEIGITSCHGHRLYHVFAGHLLSVSLSLPSAAKSDSAPEKPKEESEGEKPPRREASSLRCHNTQKQNHSNTFSLDWSLVVWHHHANYLLGN